VYDLFHNHIIIRICITYVKKEKFLLAEEDSCSLSSNRICELEFWCTVSIGEARSWQKRTRSGRLKIGGSGLGRQRPYGKKSGRIAPHVDTMYVMETGGHKVAPVPTSTRVKKVVDYNKTMNQHHHHRHHEGGGGGGGGGERGGGTHIAATVKNTVRRLLRRTKSHRDAPSTNASTMTSAVANGHPIVPPSMRISRNDYDVLPPSSNANFKRYSRARVRLQVRKQEITIENYLFFFSIVSIFFLNSETLNYASIFSMRNDDNSLS